MSYLNHDNADCAQRQFQPIDFYLANGMMPPISLHFWSVIPYVCLFSPGDIAALWPFTVDRLYGGVKHAGAFVADP
jgi:hypothetical protein